jgi:serine/threonine-protein kinase
VPVNTAVAPGTVITLQVSTGTVKLPDVHGKTFDDGRAEINHAGFPVVHEASTTVTTTDKSKDGLVADEDPTPGNAYAPSTTITLKLYKYVPPAPTCTTSQPPSGSPSGGPSGPSTSASSSTGLPPCTTS